MIGRIVLSMQACKDGGKSFGPVLLDPDITPRPRFFPDRGATKIAAGIAATARIAYTAPAPCPEIRASSGAATSAVIGPVAAIDDIDFFLFMAFDHANQTIVPAAAPAPTRSATRIT